MEIKIKDLKYKDIFNSLNVEIKESEITSIVGKNSTGKTALLDLIYGIALEYDGEITIDNININKKSELKKLRKNMFYMIQNYSSQLFNINVLEDIRYSINDSLTIVDNNKLYEYLELLDLDVSILNKNYSEISNSELKKILIIMMIISDKKIILLDEPTLGLDDKSQMTLIKLLKKEKRKGKIIIITSQDSDFLLRVSDKVLFINNKKIIEKNNKYEFFEDKALLDKSNLTIPNTLKFKEIANIKKNKKLMYRDNLNDLLKDIYRNAS